MPGAEDESQLIGTFRTITVLLNLVSSRSTVRAPVPNPPAPTAAQKTILRDLDAAALLAVRVHETISMSLSAQPSQIEVCAADDTELDTRTVCPAPEGVDFKTAAFSRTMCPGRPLHEHLGLLAAYLRSMHSSDKVESKLMWTRFSAYILVSSCRKMHRRFTTPYSMARFNQLQNTFETLLIAESEKVEDHVMRHGERSRLATALGVLFSLDNNHAEEDELFRPWLIPDSEGIVYSKALRPAFHKLLQYAVRHFYDSLKSLDGIHKTLEQADKEARLNKEAQTERHKDGETKKGAEREIPSADVQRAFSAGQILDVLSSFPGTATHFALLRPPTPTARRAKDDDDDGLRDEVDRDAGGNPYTPWLGLIIAQISAIYRLGRRARASAAFKDLQIILLPNAHPIANAQDDWRTVLRGLVEQSAPVDVFIKAVERILPKRFSFNSGTVHCEAALAAAMARESSLQMETIDARIIGVSKRSCPVCAALLNMLGQGDSPFIYRKAHHTVTACALPAGLPIEVLKRMVKEVGRWLVEALEAMETYEMEGGPESEGPSRPSTSSIYSAQVSIDDM